MTKRRTSRERWDEDDRERCRCDGDHSTAFSGTDKRCTNMTRHPSKLCTDCR